MGTERLRPEELFVKGPHRGIHLAVGCLIDHKGQDSYYNMHGVGTGGAHDFAVGILVDRAGDDYYAGSVAWSDFQAHLAIATLGIQTRAIPVSSSV